MDEERFHARVSMGKNGAVVVATGPGMDHEEHYTGREITLLRRATGNDMGLVKEALAFTTIQVMKMKTGYRYAGGEAVADGPGDGATGGLRATLERAIDEAVREERFEVAALLKKTLASEW